MTQKAESDAPETRPETRESEDRQDFRAGFCALVGLPNVGKSTLLNRLVGEKLVIVSPRAQTTRTRTGGIYSDASHQVVFEDTPGLVEPRYLLQEGMRREAEEAARGADVVVYVADCGFSPSLEAARGYDPPRDARPLLCVNKTDRVSPERREEFFRAFEADGRWEAVVGTVASEGRGVDRLRSEVLRRVPRSPPLYPTDQLATASLRELAAEFVRECCYGALREEVPYSVAVEIHEFREDDDPVYLGGTIYVERESQKGIVIGSGGRMIRRIGTCARDDIERLVGAQVYLDLRVKVLPKWRKKAGALARLGLPLPEREETP